MNLSRLESLKKFLEEDPEDPFNWYALALETEKSDPSKALLIFEDIITRWPDYVPVYYQAAIAYERVGEIDNAQRTLEKGIDVAQRSGDHKAARELTAALGAL